jgi:DNA-binding FadR family transcriptional regulator
LEIEGYRTIIMNSGKTSMTTAPVSRDAVANYFEGQIVSGVLTPGTRLPSERQLAEQLGVSRPIVREGLRALVERNLVEVRPGRGAFVRGHRPADAASRLDTLYRLAHATPRDLVEARTMLERTAVALAAVRVTTEELAAIKMAMNACAQTSSILEQARYDLAFHLGIARAAGNPVVEVMFGSISTLTLELMVRSLSDTAVTTASLPYHVQIYEALEAHDADAAQHAMTEHLAVAQRLYGADFDQTIQSLTQRELARLFAPGVTLEELLTDGWAKGADRLDD